MKIRKKYTGEIRVVTPNVAHGLIESGDWTLADKSGEKKKPPKVTNYPTRQLRAKRVPYKKKTRKTTYKTK